MVDCKEKCWTNTIDGKWHPEWEEPEEGDKDNIRDIFYLCDRSYSMPELGERSQVVPISDGWTQTMPDGDRRHTKWSIDLDDRQRRRLPFWERSTEVDQQRNI